MSDAATVLKLAPLLADLDEDEIQLLAGAMHLRLFRAGEVITAEGSGADGFFVLESGDAGVTVQGESRGSMGPGDCFGEVALLMGSERTATIIATSDLRCYALGTDNFRDLVESNPAIAWKVMQSMADRLS